MEARLRGAGAFVAPPPAAESEDAVAGLSRADAKARCVAEMVARLVAAYKSRARVSVAKLRHQLAAKYALSTTPKLMEILAAIPDDYRDKLTPFLRVKPVRTASGIAVVALMSKPHRCPHIAMTGGVCTYCLAHDAELLTERGWWGLAEMVAVHGAGGRLPAVAAVDPATGGLEYQVPSRLIVNAAPPVGGSAPARMVSFR